MPIVLPSMARPTLTEPTYVPPPVWKPVLGWAGLVLGGLIVFAAVGTLGDGILQSVAMGLLGLAAALPGGWWLLCEHRDRARAEEDFRLDRQAEDAKRAMAGMVSPGALAPLTWDTPLVPFARRWPVVGSVAGSLLLGSVALMPSVEPAPSSATSIPPATSTVTATSTQRAETATTTVTYSSTTESAASATQVAVETEPEREPVSEPAPEPSYVPAPARTYAPAPLADPAPQSAYYPNCSAARAAGVAPLLRGQPGYAAKLDRDNDGVACE